MKIKILLTFTLISFVFAAYAPVVYANNSTDSGLYNAFLRFFGGTEDEDEIDKELDDKIGDLKDKIKEYEDKIKKLENEEQSLQRDIDYANSQISLTELRIQSTIAQIEQKENQIERLGTDIDKLRNRIDRLGDSIDFQIDVLNERMRARYKVYNPSPVIVLFGSDTLNSLVQKTKYLETLELQDTKLLKEMKKTKDDFSLQKGLFEEKKVQAEELKREIEGERANLESYRADLNRQKADKEELLRKTENDEQKFRQLLAQVQSELAALQLAINLPDGEGADVKRGDIIGLMGNTGCSSGPHVHFGYVKGGKARDPLPKLEDGDLKWPVGNPYITQYFGENYSFYMNNFGIPGHDALDIIDTQQWSGAPVKAAKDGKLYYAQDSKVYCPWLNNSLGKGAIIDHGDGERTIYWHIQ